MNPFSVLRVEIIRRPIFNILIVLLAIFWGNLGWAVIVLTILVRLLLIRNSAAAANMQWSMGKLQPKLTEIQEKYKDDPQMQSQEMMKLFKSSWWWPLKWCLWLLLQIPIFLWLFYTVRDFADWSLDISMYSFVELLNVDISQVDTVFYGLDLLSSNNIALAIVAWVLFVMQMKITTMFKPNGWMGAMWWLTKQLWWGEWTPDMSKIMGNMNYIFAAMMGFFVYSTPSAVGLYIMTTTFFWVGQQVYMYRPALVAKLKSATSSNDPDTPTIIEE